MGDVVLLEPLKARKLLPNFSPGGRAFALIEMKASVPIRSSSSRIFAGRALPWIIHLANAKSDKQFKRAQELKQTMPSRLNAIPRANLAKIRNLKTRASEIFSPRSRTQLRQSLTSGTLEWFTAFRSLFKGEHQQSAVSDKILLLFLGFTLNARLAGWF
jgi:hypothetical protein